MTRLRNILTEHKLAVVLAILTALIVAFPQIYFRIDQKEVYQGIELIPSSPWLPRVREVQDGHLNWGSIYHKDGKDLPYLFQPLGTAVVAYMGKIFGLEINNTMLLFRATMPSAVFLLIYCFVLLLSRSRLIALCSATVIILAEPIIYAPGFLRLLNGVAPSKFLEIARPVNSAMIYLLFFGFLISFWKFYVTKSWRWGLVSAVILGLNFYNYFYTWTYLYAFLGVLILIFLIQKKWQEAIRIFYVFLGGLIVAVPYIINLYRAMQHPAYDDVGIRGGLVVSHAPIFVGSIVIGALVLFFLGFPKEDRKKYYFSLALMLAPFITMNQQVLTGKAMQSAHYHWYFHKPMAAIFVIWIIFYFLSRKNFDFYKKALAAMIIIISLYTGAFTQVASYLNDEKHGLQLSIESQKYGPVMKWLSEHAPKEAMVFSNEDTAEAVVIYTPLNVFHHVKAHLSLASTEERMYDTLFTYYRLEGINSSNARELFYNDERVFISSRMYGLYYRQALGSYEAIPDEKIDTFLNLYLQTLPIQTKQWLREIFKKYEVEYIIWDKKENPSWQLDRFNFLEQRAGFGDLVIYQVIP